MIKSIKKGGFIMKIILTHIIRNIKEKKGRSLLIILSLMIASIVFILNLTIPNQIIESNMNTMRQMIGSSDLLLASYDEFDINNLNLNQEKINYVGVNEFISELNISIEEANNIYNISSSIIVKGIKNKLKYPFKNSDKE